MKLIIAGSRGISVFSDFIYGLKSFHNLKITEVVSGTATGIDKSGEYYAEHYNIKCVQFPAEWKTEDGEYNAKAGHERNAKMADYADALLLIWDGKSPGSKNMLKEMKKRKKPIYEVIIRKHNVQY